MKTLRAGIGVPSGVGRLAPLAIACTVAWSRAQLPADPGQKAQVRNEAIDASSQVLSLTGNLERGRESYHEKRVDLSPRRGTSIEREVARARRSRRDG